MIIDLSAIQFENDSFSYDFPDGNVLKMYLLDESLVYGEKAQDISAVALELVLYGTDEDTGETIVTGNKTAPCVIGMCDEYMKIDTLYSQYKGQILTKDNISFCTLEYFDASE